MSQNPRARRERGGHRRRAGSPALLLTGVACSLLACSCSEAPDKARDHSRLSELPDIVLVVIDTLRPDHLSSYGYERETAPFLAQLAERSILFERAFSTSSWTAPSTASIFTGLYPNQHGVVGGFKMHRKLAEDEEQQTIELVMLPVGQLTLPELLADAGYRTFGVSANINIGEELGFTRGFDEFERMHKDDARELVDRVLVWRAELTAETPSFLYLHFNDVHKPYEARPPWYEAREEPLENTIARYDSEISHLDAALARLSQELGWDADTVIMVVSDHGEEFKDHGAMGHRFSLHSELNRVLMMLHAPGLVGAAGRVEANVGLVDVLPTLLDVAQVEPESGVPGRSIVTLAADHEDDFFAQRTLFAHRKRSSGEHLWAAIRGDWKLIDNPGAEASLLFDMRADFAELNDLTGTRAEVAADLGAQLSAFREQYPIPTGQLVEVKVDDELFEHLEKLGYVDGD